MNQKTNFQSNSKKVFVLLFGVLIISSCQQEAIEPASVAETAIAIKNQTLEEALGEEIDRLKLVALSRDFKVPIQEAQEIAMETASQMRELEGILTKSPLAISSVEKIIGDRKEQVVDTKSEEVTNDTTVSDMYLFNFENDQGYVLMSGDERAAGVLAYASRGHLGDSIDNPGQGLLLERSMYFIENKRKEFETMERELIIAGEEDMFQQLPKEVQDSLINEGIFDEDGKRIITKAAQSSCYDVSVKGGPAFAWSNCDNENNKNNKYYCRWTRSARTSNWRTTTYKPLLKTLWNQKIDYNADVDHKCPERASGRAPVGCVATAVGQILTYHHTEGTRPKVSVFKGRTINWEDMVDIIADSVKEGHIFSGYSNVKSSKARGDISHLLFHLGDNDLLDMDYACDGSVSNNRDALRTFKKLGYNGSWLTGYDGNKVVSEIISNRPVYISGCGIKKRCFLGWCLKPYESCHAWVLDGYVSRSQTISVTYRHTCNPSLTHTASYSRTHKLVHNNFGWGNENNDKDQLKGTAKTDSGWYRKGLFDSNNGPDAASETYRSGDPKNFKYDNKMIINIR